ncbi:MAG: (d)CMP kinase [Sporomusaceae bacterium]|nr:(d)CMP kinase [Sporomusaceae bacterium]
MKRLTVAIDGPAGAGKSTVAKVLASRLNYTYVDTGAMYRAIAWQALEQGIDKNDIAVAAKLTELAEQTTVTLRPSGDGLEIFVGEIDITAAIRTPQVTSFVAEVAKVAGVRAALLSQQRRMAASGGVVMDGRDIGTKVFPEAEVKVFLTASVETRAKRRHAELAAKGYEVELAQLAAEIAARDKLDSERACAPLVQAEDAVYLDTSELTIDQAVQFIFQLCEAKGQV